MLKTTVNYKDFDGVECEEQLFFNLTQAELLELQAEFQGDIVGHLSRVLSTGDHKLIMSTFKLMILRSYGVKSEDGKRFIKQDGELAKLFVETMAYDEFIVGLLKGGAAGAAEFVNAVMPESLTSQLPTTPEMLERATVLLGDGKSEDAIKILTEVPVPKEVVLHNETPVTDENVPRHTLPGESFSQLAANRLAPPPEEPVKLAKDMSIEDLEAALAARKAAN